MKPSFKNILMITLTVLALTFSALGVTPARAAGIRYATPAGTGDCSSWANACTLQTALTGAVSGDEIWVAAGAHKPTTGTDRTATFQLKNGVAVYGGFAGAETARDQRSSAINLTVLSGDIDNNDSQTPIITNLTTVTGNTTNSYHVVTGATGATLDGFTITAGYAAMLSGSGMYNQGSSPTLTNVTFAGNWAYYGGGGMYNKSNSSPTLTIVTFSGNSAGNGGGIYNESSSNPTLANVTFSGNSASGGAGIYNDNSNPTLMNVTFSSNSAGSGGGVYNWYSSPTLTNVTFSGNSASNEGGGMANNFSNPTLKNVTFSNNSVAGYGWGGGGMFNWGSSPQIRNTLFWGNTGTQIYTRTDTPGTPSVSDSVVQNGCPAGSTCTNLITADPLLGTLGSYGGYTQTIPLLAESSAINEGSDVVCPARDQRELFRPQGSRCDIGAYEYEDAELDTRIDTFPTNPSKSAEASFTFSSPDNSATFECSLDGANFVVCPSPKGYTGLADGSHTFTVRAKDALGNLDNTPPSYTWEIRTEPLYAKPSATGTGDCTNWANACTLQTALTKTFSIDEIWVAAGTYKPTTNPTDRAATFQLKSGAAIYGGFAGTETTRDQRNPVANPSILSGDIDNNDSQTPVITEIKTVTGNATNSFHVVTGADGATLDGFTITAGYAIVSAGLMGKGGGVYNVSSSPTLANIIFSGNLAWQGGGMYNEYSSPILTNITFNGNLADKSGYGGGMSNWYSSSPTLTNVTFSSNLAYNGGGMYMDGGSPTLTNVTFSGNSATSVGGGMYHSGGSGPQIHNAIFWSNTAVYSGAQIYASNSDLLSVSDSVVQDGYEGAGMNIYTGDPKLGALGNYGGFTQTFPLLAGSSAINLGNDAVCPATDQRGVARPQNTHCDIGAYESDAPLYPSLYYVKPAASGTGDCSSWANACTLQTALGKAIVEDEIWAAAGVYKPTTNPADRNAAFRLRGGVAIYGGFAGTETMRNQRNPTANLTILSGDIDNNDSQKPVITNLATVTGNTTNSYHVVIGASRATLDGFTITAGKTVGNSFPQITSCGAGMYNISGSSPTLANITFSGNSATNGGGMCNKQSSPTLTNIIFSGNSAGEYGGGMFNYNFSNPAVMNVIFSGNLASYGGGMFNGTDSNPTLTDVTFSGNSAYNNGGGMHNWSVSPTLTNITFSSNSAAAGGGMYNESASSPTLTNVTFSGNSATDYAGNGGGMLNRSSNPILTNITFSGNSAGTYGSGGGVYNFYSSPEISNTLFWGNMAPNGAQISNYDGNSAPIVSDSIVQGGCPAGNTCSNIITGDPKLGTFGNYGGFTQVIPLLAGSSAIDAGDDTVCPDTDQRGLTRPQGTHCDIGAYEYGEQTFNDVPVTHWAWDYVERLYAANITGGCGSSPLIYCPEKPVTRAQMAIFIERGMNGSAFTPPPASGTVFGDVAATYWAAAWIEQLAADNITGGCGNGNYCPDNPVTRAQMAVFLLKAMHGSSYLPPAVGDSSGFADVPSSYWAAAWIKQLAAEGITGGCGAGNYCPDRPVTRAQMAVFLVKAFNLP